MMSDPQRADPFDLSDFQPTPPKKPPTLSLEVHFIVDGGENVISG